MQQQKEEVRWAVQYTDDRVGSKNYALCCFFRAICLLLNTSIIIEVFKYYYLLMLLQQLTVSVALSRRTVKKLRGIGNQNNKYIVTLVNCD